MIKHTTLRMTTAAMVCLCLLTMTFNVARSTVLASNEPIPNAEDTDIEQEQVSLMKLPKILREF